MRRNRLTRLTESRLRGIVHEAVKRVLAETAMEDTDNQKIASYFQIMRLRLSGLSNYDENPDISSRAREILDDINSSDMSPIECLETYWDESQELKRQYQSETGMD